MADESIDYTRAGEYITDYFDKQETIMNEFGNSIRDALTNFFLISTIPEEKVDSPLLSLLFDLAWVAAPQIRIVSVGLSKVQDYYKKGIRERILNDDNKKKLDAVAGELVKKAEELVKGKISGQINKQSTDSSSSDSVNKFTSKTIDDAGKLRRALLAMVWYEREVFRKSRDLMFDTQPDKRGKLKDIFEKTLGPIPTFDMSAIDEFGKRYELTLYKRFFEKKGQFKYYSYKPFLNSPYHTVITVENIPKEVVKRVTEIKKSVTEELAFREWTMEKVYKKQREELHLTGGQKF